MKFGLGAFIEHQLPLFERFIFSFLRFFVFSDIRFPYCRLGKVGVQIDESTGRVTRAAGCEEYETFLYPCVLHAVCCKPVSTCCLLQSCLTC